MGGEENMINKNITDAQFELAELISELSDPSLIDRLKNIMALVSAIPNDPTQTIIKYEQFNDRDILLKQIQKLNQTCSELIERSDNEKEDHEIKIEAMNMEMEHLNTRVSDLLMILQLQKKLLLID